VSASGIPYRWGDRRIRQFRDMQVVVHQLLPGMALPHRRCGQALAGERSDQVVEPVPARARPGQQVPVGQTRQQTSGSYQWPVHQSGHGVHVKNCAGMHAQQRERTLQVRWQARVGDGERREDAAITVVELGQPGVLILQACAEVGEVVRLAAEPGGGDADGQRQSTAGGHDAVHASRGGRFGGQPRAGHGPEQGRTVGGGQDAKPDQFGLVQGGEPGPAGDQRAAPGHLG
jgi:hypothetical protein